MKPPLLIGTPWNAITPSVVWSGVVTSLHADHFGYSAVRFDRETGDVSLDHGTIPLSNVNLVVTVPAQPAASPPEAPVGWVGRLWAWATGRFS